jgi:hypothetical protein
MGWSNVSTSSGSGGGVESVTGLNTDNTDPLNPVIDISISSGITGTGTPVSPLIASSRGLYSQRRDSTPVSGTLPLTLIGSGVGSLTVPENTFNNGDSFRADFGGLLSAKNGEELQIVIRSNTVVLADSGLQTMSAFTDLTNAVWSLSVIFSIRQIGGIGVASIVTFSNFSFVQQSNGNAQGFGFSNVNNFNFDTTVNNTLSVTAQWDSSDPANSIYSDVFVLQKIY